MRKVTHDMMTVKRDYRRIDLRLPPDLFARLVTFCASENENNNSTMRTCLHMYLTEKGY